MRQTVSGFALKGRLTMSLCLASLLAVAGCANGGPSLMASKEADPVVTGSTTGAPSIRALAEAAQAWQEKPGSVRRAVTYARLLDEAGQKDQLIRVLETTITHNPDDPKLVAYLGKELILSGRSRAGVEQLNKAIGAGETNWKNYSALGSGYDQMGQHAQARDAYDKALALNPQEVAIHNNIGMSYILEGNLPMAESSLRAAQKLPEGEFNQTLRQNLALAVGLQGRFDEARDIASRDLPPDQVEQNLAFLKKMLNQENTWQQIKQAS
jgi:Flp pilus assembly protein TadD